MSYRETGTLVRRCVSSSEIKFQILNSLYERDIIKPAFKKFCKAVFTMIVQFKCMKYINGEIQLELVLIIRYSIWNKCWGYNTIINY